MLRTVSQRGPRIQMQPLGKFGHRSRANFVGQEELPMLSNLFGGPFERAGCHWEVNGWVTRDPRTGNVLKWRPSDKKTVQWNEHETCWVLSSESRDEFLALAREYRSAKIVQFLIPCKCGVELQVFGKFPVGDIGAHFKVNCPECNEEHGLPTKALKLFYRKGDLWYEKKL